MEPQFFRPIVDDASAYRQAIRNAEENAGTALVDESGHVVVVEQETPDAIVELAEAVPVQASDQPLDTEPVVEETPDTPEEEQQEALEVIVPDPLSKIAELEARLAEKDSFIGRQSTEIGDLRSAVDEIRQNQAQPVPQQAPAVQITQEFIENDPARATLLAFEQKNQAALEIAFEQWKEYEPFAAGQWLTDQRLAEQQAKIDAKFAETQKAFDERTAPIAQQQEEQAQNIAWAQAFDTAKSGRPDFIENAERLLSEVAPLHPSYLPLLQSADPAVKADALVALYAIDKIGNPEAVAQQLGEKAREAADEADAARNAGAVVSGQTTTGNPVAKRSDEELEADKYLARMNTAPSLARGWTGGASRQTAQSVLSGMSEVDKKALREALR